MTQPKRILVFRQSSLGDVILTLPVLDRLKAAFPGHQIDYVTKTAYAPILSGHPPITKLYSFSSDREFFKLASALKNVEYSLLIDLQANMRSIILRSLARPARTLRYKKRRLSREMVVRRPRRKLRVDHTISAYLKTLEPLGIDQAMTHPVLCPQSGALESAAAFLKSKGITGKPIAICPGARHPEKRWQHEQFRDVARLLLDDPQTAIIVISSRADNLPDSLGINSPRLIELRDWGLADVAAVMSLCRLAITNDSGLMHLANAVGVRALAIFGPTNPRLGFAPALPGSEVVCDDVFCSPCSVHGKRPCRQQEKYCFKDITPSRVFQRARAILGA